MGSQTRSVQDLKDLWRSYQAIGIFLCSVLWLACELSGLRHPGAAGGCQRPGPGLPVVFSPLSYDRHCDLRFSPREAYWCVVGFKADNSLRGCRSLSPWHRGRCCQAAGLGRAITALPPPAWDAIGQPLPIRQLGHKAHKLAARLRQVRSSDDLYRSLVSEWGRSGCTAWCTRTPCPRGRAGAHQAS